MPVWAEWAARPFSWLGGWIGITLITAVLVGELVRRRRWATAVLVAGVLTGAQLLSALLKVAFDRPRPDVGSAVPLPGSAAFPSGHATSASAFFGLLTLFAIAAAPPGRARWAVGALGAAVALAIAASRVVLNVHYVGDVLAGLALGAAWLAACLLVAGRRQGEPGPPEDPARSRHEGVHHP
jgi:undecaprenyl-diphosphatase